MKNTISLKENREFIRLYKKGRFYVGCYIILYVCDTRLTFNRLGITASKKVGNSVIRNRIRRLIRENYRMFEPYLLGFHDFVFVARYAETLPNFSEIKKEMKYLLKKLKVLDVEKWAGEQSCP